jgi:uncharacterized membrane protein
VLILILGLVVLAALFVTVVIDVSTLYLERRSLIAAADGAALAGAQAVDRAVIYQQGLPHSGPLPLDADAAVVAAREYLVAHGVQQEFPNLTVIVDTTETTVEVQLSARIELPVTNGVTPGARNGVTVATSAMARTPVIPN